MIMHTLEKLQEVFERAAELLKSFEDVRDKAIQALESMINKPEESDKLPRVRKPRALKRVRYIQKPIYAAVIMYISGAPP